MKKVLQEQADRVVSGMRPLMQIFVEDTGIGDDAIVLQYATVSAADGPTIKITIELEETMEVGG